MSKLSELHQYGQSFWWDALSRAAIEDGTIARLRDEDGMRGITSNPSIFQSAISSGHDYDAPLSRLLADGHDRESAFWELAIADIQDTCDLLRGVYDQSDGADGFVSLEVSPALAFETDPTTQQAIDLWRRVDRPNLMIKIPGTDAGVPAIRAALTAGVNVNVTLLFSLDAHVKVMEAYLDALEARQKAGNPVDDVASVASFFVSRVDTLIDGRLEALGTDEALALRGQAGVANARLAYARFLEIFSGPRWEALVAAGARVQRPLWASTSVKNPDYDPLLYVDTLIGRDTVNTLPTVTVDVYRTQGNPGPDRVLENQAGSRRHLEALESLGISMDDVTAELLDDGVKKFQVAFDSLLADLDAKATRLARPGS